MVEFYNYSYPSLNESNVTGIGSLFNWANQVTYGGFGLGIIVAFWMISMITMTFSTGNFRKAFAASTLMSTIIAILLRGLTMTTDAVVIIMIILTVIAGLWLFFGED